MNVAIFGAGVAGLSAGIALRQQQHSVRIYERRTSVPRGGGLVLWPNAMFVLDALGLAQSVMSASGSVHAMHRYTQGGELLGTLDIGQLDALMGQPSRAILRCDLQRILVDAASDLGVALHWGQAVDDFAPEASGQVCARLADGKFVHADLLIGAEGRMSSAARRFVAGSSQAVYQGFVNWIGVLDGTDMGDLAGTVNDYWGVGERFGFVTVGGHCCYWAGAAAVALPGSAIAAPDDLKQHLLQRFGAWPKSVAELIAGTSAATIRTVYVHDHDPLDCWHRGNVLLVGDAAHAPLPTSGQGACQALEDAWHLARCLGQAGPTLDESLAGFTAMRQPKTTTIIQAGRQLARDLFATDASRAAVRDAAARKSDMQLAVANMAQGWGRGLGSTVTELAIGRLRT